MDSQAKSGAGSPSVPPVSSTAADFMRRMHAKGARSRKKKLVPQGRVPRGVRGIARHRGPIDADRANHREPGDARRWITQSPAWAVSVALHLVAAVILMNVVYFARNERVGQIFRMVLRASSPGGDRSGPQDAGTKGKDNEDAAPAGKPSDDAARGGSGPALPPRDVTAPPLPMGVVSGVSGSGKDGPGGIYAGRGGAGRGEALRRYGGDGVSEQAVTDGLDWLAAHQSPEGCWDISLYSKQCPKGQECGSGAVAFGFGGFDGYRAAVTGLAVLSFLGAGYSHLDDHLRPQDGGQPVDHPYKRTIEKALAWLAKAQKKDGLIIGGNVELERAMYSHGMAALALIEAYSVTHDPDLRSHAQLAVNFTVHAQQDAGGWDYGTGQSGRSDVSVTSWQVLGLRSARAAGLAVPRRAWARARNFLDVVTNRETGEIGYDLVMPNDRVDPGCNAMVAAGWVTRVYLGMPEDQALSAKFAERIRAVAPRYDEEWGACNHWSNLRDRKAVGHWSLYYTYNATLAMFHHGGDDWTWWNERMRACTLKTQRKDGHTRGSWDPSTSDAMFGGRVYATAMNVLNLEVYYRYLPVYEVGAEFGLTPLVDEKEWAPIAENSVKGNFHLKKTDVVDDPAAPPDVKTTELLIADLGSDEMMTRRNAAKELSARADKAAIKAMIQAAKSEKTSLRPVLIEYLGGFGDSEEILDYLVDTLSEESRRIREAAGAALKKATGKEFGPFPSDWRNWRRERKK